MVLPVWCHVWPWLHFHVDDILSGTPRQIIILRRGSQTEMVPGKVGSSSPSSMTTTVAIELGMLWNVYHCHVIPITSAMVVHVEPQPESHPIFRHLWILLFPDFLQSMNSCYHLYTCAALEHSTCLPFDGRQKVVAAHHLQPIPDWHQIGI